MTASTRTLSAAALVLALGSALSMTAVSTVHAADDTMEKMLRRCPQRQERLRRRRRHHLRRYRKNGLSGQRLEIGPQRHLHHHGKQNLPNRFRPARSVQSQVLIASA